jgi:hypothetical protein
VVLESELPRCLNLPSVFCCVKKGNLLADTTPVKGPYTFARFRELWDAGDISADSKLFLTERDDETNGVKCFNLRAAHIRENLDSGRDVDVASLYARVMARDRK